MSHPTPEQIQALWTGERYMEALMAAWTLPNRYKDLHLYQPDMDLRDLVFRACRQAVQEGIKSKEGLQGAKAWVGGLLESFKPKSTPPAPALVERGEDFDPDWCRAYREAVIHLHLTCTRIALETPWTAGEPSMEALQAALRDLHTSLTQGAGDSPLPPYLCLGFLRRLTDEILDRTSSSGVRRPALFPLVWSDERGEPQGRLAWFQLGPLGGGTGDVFLAPEQAFTPLRESFASIFTLAPKAARRLLMDQGLPIYACDIEVRIADFPGNGLIEDSLTGNSGGGALALGLWSVWSRTPLDPGVVTSFALSDTDYSKCYSVGGLRVKAREVANQKGGAGLFLVEKTDKALLLPVAKEMLLKPEGAVTLQEAVDFAVGAGHYIRARLEYLEDNRRWFTPLVVHVNRHPTDSELLLNPRVWLTQGPPGEANPRIDQVRERIDDLQELLRRGGNYVLVGDPGGGKTFTLEAIERIALEEYLNDRSSRLPVFLPLGEWEKVVGRDARERLKNFVLSQAKELKTVFDAYLAAGRFLFLCDALNQMPEYGAESLPVQHLREWIKEFGERDERVPGAGSETRCRFIFTCRTENYQASLPARRVDVEPLDDDRIEEMARRYLGPDGTPPFLEALHARGVWALCFNPQTLWMFILLQQSRNELPQSRGELFRAVRDLFFERAAQRAKGAVAPRKVVEAGLMALGFQMLSEKTPDTGTGVCTVVSREEADAKMAPALPPGTDAEGVLEAARDAQFVKVEQRDRDFPTLDRVYFIHHRWQEFWAALQLARDRVPDGKARLVWERFLVGEVERRSRKEMGIETYDPLPPPPPTGWEEPLLMLAGFHPLVDTFVQDVVKHNPVLAARCLYEGRAAVHAETRAAVVRALHAVLATPSRAPGAGGLQARIAAGEALGHLGYIGERWVAPNTHPILPEMVEIVRPGATGRFEMGSTAKNLNAYKRQLGKVWNKRWAEDEQPAHTVELDAYCIGKYPVTVREFAQFVEAGGYEQDQWWTEEGLEWLRQEQPEAPRFWNDPQYHRPNYPVVGVCWYEANAYLRWLSARSGKEYRLPTEAEWEYAARGSRGRLWPWGDEWPEESEHEVYFNGGLGSTYAGGPTAVGMYPLGSNPEGVCDLVGNVWEWCSDWYGAYEGEFQRNPVGPHSGVGCVLRGGSWDLNNPDVCRAADRDRSEPATRFDSGGFRGASGL